MVMMTMMVMTTMTTMMTLSGRILYGGSVTAANCRELAACPDIDGKPSSSSSSYHGMMINMNIEYEKMMMIRIAMTICFTQGVWLVEQV